MTAAAPFTATIIGSPRIGPNREHKRAVEKYWAGRIDRAEGAGQGEVEGAPLCV